ncbi:4'-phosphopantetheinyl transferase [Mycobacterium sp.]|uniref:4'-phosphopantetheinyl transferase PptT n=1 Tax=Mycobacterium sp. TaxID=1785 RepID=UPI0031D16110
MSGLLSSVLPADRADLAAVELFCDPPGLAPLPGEEPLIARSVAKRRNEFVTVRHCARIALGQLGLPSAPILKGDKGEPCWPDGVVGSLTHTTGYRGAVVGRAATVRSVGIDAEPHDTLPHGVLDAISLPRERGEIAALPAGLHWDRILFCAKEATYKAWFPLTRRWLGFEDAHITFSRERACLPGDTPQTAAQPRTLATSGGFTSTILIDPAARSGPPLTALRGRWLVRDGLVLTAIVL